MTTWNITDADRDVDGKILLTSAQPRPLSDLLPSAEPAARQPARPISPRVWLATLSAGLLVVVAALAFAIGHMPAPPRALPAAAATAAPSPVATPAPSPVALPRSVVAFAAPGGEVLGPIDAGRAYAFVGRYGDAWLMIDAGGNSGRVWVRRADLALDGADQQAIARTPDLAPPPTPRTEEKGLSAESSAHPNSVLSPQSSSLAQATSEPEVCVRTDFGERCGPASEMQDQQRIASEIATESKTYSQNWLATATAEASK